MNKEQILALAEKCGIFPRLTPAGTDEVWSTKRDVESFFNAAIESYKAELLKGAGEPVAEGYFKDDRLFAFRLSDMVVVKRLPEGVSLHPLYTSDQVAAAILKANKPLEEEVDSLEADKAYFEIGCDELRSQLAAAQEENGRLENQVLARDAELWGRTQEILGLKDQLAKAEQRVAEACALTYLEDYDLTDIAERVRAGEWRKHMKGD